MVTKTPKPSFSLGRYKAWDPFAKPDKPPSEIAKQSRKELKQKPLVKAKPGPKPRPKPVVTRVTEPRPKKKRKQYKSKLSQVVRVPNPVLPAVLALIDDFRQKGKLESNPNDPDSY